MTRRIHIKIADRGWILEKCAKEIAERNPAVTFGTEDDGSAEIQYYINYSARSRRVSPVEIAFFTHSENDETARRRYFDTAAEVDHCVCMSAKYAQELVEHGIPEEKVSIIAPGVDLEAFRPKVRIGVVGRTYHTGRKGEALVAQVMDVPGIEWCFTGSGWPGPSIQVPDDGLADFYNSLDYVLVPALYEGGPMSVLEGLACGVPIIASDVGWVKEFPHLAFENGNADSLRKVLENLVSERESLRASVASWTWDAWADLHQNLFHRLGKTNNSPAGVEQEFKRNGLHVTLLTHGVEQKALGGPSVRIPRTASELARLGVDSTLLSECANNFTDDSISHIFNVWPVEECFGAIDRAKAVGKRVVFSPIFLNLANQKLATQTLPRLFAEPHSELALDSALTEIAQQIADEPNLPVREPFDGYHARVRACVSNADEVIALSEYELRCLDHIGAVPRSATIVHNPVDVERFANADPDLFARTHTLDDYILCVGRIEPRKNQLVLAYAARTMGKKVVFIGHTENQAYYDLVRRTAGEYSLFIPRIDPASPLLPSAFAGASVFCLPSWSEGAPLSGLEAAAAGIPMVLSDRSSEREYFGEFAEYVNPADIRQMRAALDRAAAKKSDEGRRAALQAHVRERFNWNRYARETAAVYQRAATADQGTAAFVPAEESAIFFDLTTTFHASGHPTGIARVEDNVLQALIEQLGPRLVPIVWSSRTKNYLRLSHTQALIRPSLADIEKMEANGEVNLARTDCESGGRIIVVGGAWIRNSEYISALQTLKSEIDANLTVLVHDLIQIKLAHFYPDGVGSEFEKNARLMSSAADDFLVYSDCTLDDLHDFLLRNGQVYKKISKFRLGDMTNLHLHDGHNDSVEIAESELQKRFKGKKFAIFVSSIEVRKNHALLINVWRRLIAERGSNAPHLLFIGRTFWRGQETVDAIAREEALGRFVHVLDNVDDRDLDWFYRNCCFTLFPSLYEGWGLPVAESLSYGKLCITTATTATREIAPDLTELLDPYDFKAWRDRIAFYLDSPIALERIERKISVEYRDHGWDRCASEIMAAVDSAPRAVNLAAPVFPYQVLSFSSQAGRDATASMCRRGWGRVEKVGRWTLGPESRLVFRYPSTTKRCFMRLQVRAFTRTDDELRCFDLEINGIDQHPIEVGMNLGIYDLEVPLKEDGSVEIIIRPREVFSPKEVARGEDDRLLGLYFTQAGFADELADLPEFISTPDRPQGMGDTPPVGEIDPLLQRAREVITIAPRFTGSLLTIRLARLLGIDSILLRRHKWKNRRVYDSLNLILDYLQNQKR